MIDERDGHRSSQTFPRFDDVDGVRCESWFHHSELAVRQLIVVMVGHWQQLVCCVGLANANKANNNSNNNKMQYEV